MALLVLGIIGGIYSGLFGIGGGSVYVPVIVLLLHQSQQAAQGLSLAVMIPTALLGGVFYLRRQLIEKKLLGPLIVGGIFGAIMGALIANSVDALLLSRFFAVFLLYGGIKMLKG